MSGIAGLMVPPARRTQAYAELLLAGIRAEDFGRRPRFKSAAGETVVNCNHPAFVFGHLSLYPARLLALLGEDARAAATPGTYGELFAAGKECRDDPEGAIYPAMDEIVGVYKAGHAAAIGALERTPDEVLLRAHPDEAVRQRFPTIGSVAIFYLNNHVMVHMGQVSTWRRCMGLPSAM